MIKVLNFLNGFQQFSEESNIGQERKILQSLLIWSESNNFVATVEKLCIVCVMINNKQNIPVLDYYCLKFDILFQFPVRWYKKDLGLPWTNHK